MQDATKNYTLEAVTDYTAHFECRYLLLPTPEIHKDSI